MDKLLHGCAAVLVAVILISVLGNDRKDMGMLIGTGVCCMVVLLALEYLKPVLDFIGQLENMGDLDHSLIQRLLKIVGTGVISEIAALICADSGNHALGKSVQYLACAVILWLCLPLYAMLLELLQKIMGEL